MPVTTRRKVLYSMLGCAAAAAYPCYIEPRWLDLSRRRVILPRLECPVNLLQLSDLHASEFVSLGMIETAVNLGLSAKPDLICLTGDFISYRDVPDAAAYARILRRLSQAAPTFAVLGNHDGGRWGRDKGFPDHRYVDRVLEMAEIPLLHNRAVRLEPNGQPLSLAGVGDVWAGEMKAARAFAGVKAGDHPVVLLSHNPDTKTYLGQYPWDLMLSGHTHGGQVIIPFYGPPIIPVADLRYLAGLKPWGDRQIHVTKGVGNLLGVRFDCRPEVSLLELSPAQPS